ncbi:MAG: NB-ARC domain-containing protein [Microlunatus sp.]|nr:NB-ARC domain-containing protein [Microlunatus sp.]
MTMHLRVLGSVELAEPNAPVDPLPARLRRLLAGLLIHADTVVSVDALADIVWGDAIPKHPPASLHNLVARLRKRLAAAGAEASLATRPPGYCLQIAHADFDASQFEDLVGAARRTRGAGRDSDRTDQVAGLIDRALNLWRGTAYSEFCDEDFARAESARLVELRTGAVEERIDLALDLGRPAEALDRLGTLIAADPLRERPQRQLMLARYRSGHQVEALEGYHSYRRLLGDELGLEPSAALLALQSAILRHDAALQLPAVRTPTGRVGIGLPTESPEVFPDSEPTPRSEPGRVFPRSRSTGLIGRDADLARLDDLVQPGDVVTLVGPGGTGKTSLATAAAARLANRFPDGIWVCELAALTDPTVVPDVIGTLLAVPRRHGVSTRDRLVEYLRPLRLLLVLDNCEQILDGCAELITAVSRDCPGVAVLATSREPLDVAGERMVLVAPLGDEAAVALFVERAGRVSPGFSPDAETTAIIDELCRRLDRLPLAVELAAVRMRVMSAEDLLRRISWRFRRLHAGGRAARHQSLGALIDWSYDLLDPSQRTVFELISVFAGGFTLEAAEHLITQVPHLEASLDYAAAADLVLTLVDRSMIMAYHTGRRPRYALLETLRAYARDRLAAGLYADSAYRAHATYIATQVDEEVSGLYGRRHAEAAARLDGLLAEVRSAHDWALTHDLALAERLATSLWPYVETRMPAEVPQWAERTLDAVQSAASGTDGPTIARLCAVAAAGARFAGDLPRARQLIERGLAEVSDPADEAYLRFVLGDVALFEGQLDEAARLADELVAAAGAGLFGAFEHVAQGIEPLVRGYRGDPTGGVSRADELRAQAEANGDIVGAGWMRYIRGELLLDSDPQQARPCLEQALDVGRRFGDRYLVGVSLVSVASVSSRHGDPVAAAGVFRDVVEHWHRVGDWTHQWTTIRNVADLLSRLRRDEPAAVLLGGLQTRSAPLFGGELERLLEVRSTLVRRLGQDRFDSLTAVGAGLDDNQVVDQARGALREVGSG